MLSLARGYVQNCVRRDGDWKSGIHLYWWTKSRLSKEPEINLEEIDLTGGLAPERQVLLTTWSIIMLRLTFIEDIAVYAHDHRDPLGEAIGLLDAASEKVNTFNPSRLLGWIKKEAQPYLDRLLDRERYTDLSNRLHVEDEAKTHESR